MRHSLPATFEHGGSKTHTYANLFRPANLLAPIAAPGCSSNPQRGTPVPSTGEADARVAATIADRGPQHWQGRCQRPAQDRRPHGSGRRASKDGFTACPGRDAGSAPPAPDPMPGPQDDHRRPAPSTVEADAWIMEPAPPAPTPTASSSPAATTGIAGKIARPQHQQRQRPEQHDDGNVPKADAPVDDALAAECVQQNTHQ